MTRRARLLGATAAEVVAVTGGAQRQVIVAARELGSVEVFTHGIENSERMHARRAVDTRLREIASLGARDQRDDGEPRPHGMP
jgi:hypothetical protein